MRSIPRLKPYHRLTDLGRLEYWNKNLEQEICEKLCQITQTKFCRLFSYGRSAIFTLARLFAQGRHKMAVPAYSCVAVPNAVVSAGVQPIWVDVNLNDGNLELASLEEALSTTPCDAILLTHMYGNTCEVDPVLELAKRHSVPYVFTDAALALRSFYRGQNVSSFTNASILSFSMGKHLSFLDGGALLSSDHSLITEIDKYLSNQERNSPPLKTAKKVLFFLSVCTMYEFGFFPLADYLYHQTSLLDLIFRYVRPNGVTLPPSHLAIPTRFQLALAKHQFSSAEHLFSDRKRIQQMYLANLGPTILTNQSIATNTLSHLAVRVRNREQAYERLSRAGIYLRGALFDYSLPELPQFSEHQDGRQFPNATRLAKEAINLPFYPGLREQDVIRTTSALAEDSMKLVNQQPESQLTAG